MAPQRSEVFPAVGMLSGQPAGGGHSPWVPRGPRPVPSFSGLSFPRGAEGGKLQVGEQSSPDLLQVPFSFDGLVWAEPAPAAPMECLDPGRTGDLSALGRGRAPKELPAGGLCCRGRAQGCVSGQGPHCGASMASWAQGASSGAFLGEPWPGRWKRPPGAGVSAGAEAGLQGLRSTQCCVPGPDPSLRRRGQDREKVFTFFKE